jgi:misacylated tRNA(Ala) deacylase
VTEKVYLADSYAKELEARVVRVSGNRIVLDRTIFYPGGGGQPMDTGSLITGGKELKVIGVEKEGDDIVHVVEGDATVSDGDTVKCKIDWDTRYACMRYHSALHLLDGVIETRHGSGMVTGGQIYPDRARIDIDMPGLSRDKVAEILDETNRAAQEGHRITASEMTVEEALKIPRLSRTETGRKLLETLKSVRVIDIDGIDTQADGGTHVRDTKEIGTISLSAYENKGTRRKRIEIILSARRPA